MEGPHLSQGAEITPPGVRYRVWAPGAERAAVCVWPEGRDLAAAPNTLSLRADKKGFHAGIDPEGRAGDRYLFRLDNGSLLPCPASRCQPTGVSGPALVVDPWAYRWGDGAWS